MPRDNEVITGQVRLSYVHLFEPYAISEGDDPKYSCLLLISKKDKDTIQAIRRAQKAALESGADRVFNGKVPKAWADTMHDGDEEGDLDAHPEYAGHYYMAVSSRTRPGVVDRNVNPIIDGSEIYSGCFARLALGAFAYNTRGKKGVSFGLNHVQKMGDGDYLDGRTSAEDVFGALDDDDDNESLL